MNLRDHFAASAVLGAAHTALEAEFLAARAYQIADAMLKERGEEELNIHPPEHEPAPEPALNLADFNQGSRGKLIGAMTTEWQSTAELVKASGLKYPQVKYQLDALVSEGLAEVDNTNRAHLFRLTFTHGSEGDLAKMLGFPTIADAVKDLGSWKFNELLKQYQESNVL